MSIADEIAKLQDLRASEALSEEEFNRAKAIVLGGGSSPGAAPQAAIGVTAANPVQLTINWKGYALPRGRITILFDGAAVSDKRPTNEEATFTLSIVMGLHVVEVRVTYGLIGTGELSMKREVGFSSPGQYSVAIGIEDVWSFRSGYGMELAIRDVHRIG